VIKVFTNLGLIGLTGTSEPQKGKGRQESHIVVNILAALKEPLRHNKEKSDKFDLTYA
jgi:hypothetical protein